MNKTQPVPRRKHGLRARVAVDPRHCTTVTFKQNAQAYHWITDRPRSRFVIKH